MDRAEFERLVDRLIKSASESGYALTKFGSDDPGFDLAIMDVQTARAALLDYVAREQAAVKTLLDEVRHMLELLGECEQHDHHGDCQTHFIEKPCSVVELRNALSALEATPAPVTPSESEREGE